MINVKRKGVKVVVTKMNKGDWGKVKAFFSVITSEGFILTGFKIIEGINGLFVSFPSQKKDDEYKDTILAKKELRDELTKIAINNYNGHEEDDSSDSPI